MDKSVVPLGPNVFITGANRGIGLGLVRELLRVDGIKVLFAGFRSKEQSKELHEMAKANSALKLVQIDVGNDQSIQKALAEVKSTLGPNPKLNLLINNAGILEKEGGTMQEPNREVYLRHFNVNLVGSVATTAAFLPLLREAARCGQPARIVNIGGALGRISTVFKAPADVPHKNIAYGMSKAALHHFTKMLSLDEPDIVIVAIHPGWIKTDMGGNRGVPVEERMPAVVKRICAMTKADSGKLFDHEKEIQP